MRELKFRAWSKDTKRFLDCDEWYMTCSGAKYLHYAVMPYKDDNFIIEQYTGLKDKNGKEIYIGDVVSEHHGDIIGEIVQKPSGEYRIAWLGIYGGDSSLYDHRSLCDVIGNIHETPGLLVEINDVD